MAAITNASLLPLGRHSRVEKGLRADSVIAHITACLPSRVGTVPGETLHGKFNDNHVWPQTKGASRGYREASVCIQDAPAQCAAFGEESPPPAPRHHHGSPPPTPRVRQCAVQGRSWCWLPREPIETHSDGSREGTSGVRGIHLSKLMPPCQAMPSL